MIDIPQAPIWITTLPLLSDYQVVSMAHFAGINRDPVLDWTDDNGLMGHYWWWRKKVEVLFNGPLNNANDPVKCNYIIYWSGDTGMELVEMGN